MARSTCKFLVKIYDLDPCLISVQCASYFPAPFRSRKEWKHKAFASVFDREWYRNSRYSRVPSFRRYLRLLRIQILQSYIPLASIKLQFVSGHYSDVIGRSRCNCIASRWESVLGIAWIYLMLRNTINFVNLVVAAECREMFGLAMLLGTEGFRLANSKVNITEQNSS